MDIDEAWRDQPALGVDLLGTISRERADCCDAVALDAEA
jgi:hypothetical protein